MHLGAVSVNDPTLRLGAVAIISITGVKVRNKNTTDILHLHGCSVGENCTLNIQTFILEVNWLSLVRERACGAETIEAVSEMEIHMGHGTVTDKQTLYHNLCLQQGTDSKEEAEQSVQGQGSPSEAAKMLVDNHDHRIQLFHKSHRSINDSKSG